MFEKASGREERDRSRLIMIISGIAVLAVIALIITVTKYVSPSKPVEMERIYAVSASYPDTETEFNRYCPPKNAPQTEEQAYVPNLKVLNIDKTKGEYANLGSKYIRIQCTIKNGGDRTIEGLELRMVLFGFNCEELREKAIRVIPERQGSLGPGETVPIDASIDRAPDPAKIMHARIEPYKLKLR
jgi:hypothetical protein